MTSSDVELTKFLKDISDMVISKYNEQKNKFEIPSSSNDKPIVIEPKKLTKEEIKKQLTDKGIKFKVRDNIETLKKLLDEN